MEAIQLSTLHEHKAQSQQHGASLPSASPTLDDGGAHSSTRGQDIAAGGSPLPLASCWWDVRSVNCTVPVGGKVAGARAHVRWDGVRDRAEAEHTEPLVLVPDLHGVVSC